MLPREAEAISHKLLSQGGFIEQLAAGIYNFLPLGYRVLKKVEKIIREEMDQIGGQEVLLAAMQPKSLWQESGRWDKMDPPLFKFRDRHHKELTLGPTHEEVITAMVRSRVDSYRDLPFYLYQIQNKFRNEMRATGGLLRVREFIMKDLYSFHADKADLDRYYSLVIQAYHKIFNRCELSVLISEAGSGSIGGSECHEFQLPNLSGEDRVLFCEKCDLAINHETIAGVKVCRKCAGKLKVFSTIELGHVFKLGDIYSKKLQAVFMDKQGRKKPIVMGCYGIGLGRLMASIIEDSKHHDEKGMIWPKSVAPFDAHLIAIENKENKNILKTAERIKDNLEQSGIEVLNDDRKDISAGEKFVECDLLGIPARLVVSAKTGDKIEYKKRGEGKAELLTQEELIKRLKMNS